MQAWKTWNKNPKSERTLFGTSLCTPPVGTTAGLGNWSRPGGKVFLLALHRQLELVAVSDRSWVALIVACLGSRCLVTCYCGRWTQVATYFFAFLHPLRRPTWGLRLAKQLLTLCRYKKGIKPLFMTKMNEKINIRSTWALRLAKHLLNRCNRMNKSTNEIARELNNL